MNMMKSTKKCVLVPYEKYHRLVNTQEEKIIEGSESNSDLDVQDEPTDIKDPKIKDNKLAEEIILLHLPKALKSKAKTLLDVINHNTDLDWNINGELTVKGTAVVNSHITDIVKDALVIHKQFEPVGIQEFYSHLKNTPLSLIRNPQRRELINQTGSGITSAAATLQPPPPGIPNKRKAISLEVTSTVPKKKKKADTWKKLWTKLA